MSRRGNCHDNAVVESFLQLLKRERIKKSSTERGKKPAAISLVTSKCFITVSVGMVRAIRCHRQNMKTSIINDSEVSRLSVAILHADFSGCTKNHEVKYSWKLFNITMITRTNFVMAQFRCPRYGKLHWSV